MEENLNLFRIGGCYMQQNGVVVCLGTFRDQENPAGMAHAKMVGGLHWGDGFRALLDGTDTSGFNDERGFRHLIPGELHQVNGEWVPVEAKPAQSIGALLREKLQAANKQDALDAKPSLGNAAMIARDGPAQAKCGCKQCGGTRGGVPGNENILGGQVLCDYCTADVLRANKPTPHASIAGLTRVAGFSHLLGAGLGR